MSCFRTPSPRPSTHSLDHHISSGRKHISVVSWFSVAKRPSPRPVKLQSQPSESPAANSRRHELQRLWPQCARGHLVAVSDSSQFSALRSSPHSGSCTAGGGFNSRSAQRQSRVPLCVVVPSPCRPVTPLPGPVTDICLPLNCHYYSLEVPHLTRQRICPLVAVSSVKHICTLKAFQRFLQHQGQLPTSFQQSQVSPPPTFILRYF